MANNNKENTIDLLQVFRRAFDRTEEAIRFTPSATMGFDIAFQTVAGESASISSATPIAAVIASAPCDEIKDLRLYATCLTNITGTCALSLQVSPSDTDDVWFEVGTLNAPTTAGQVSATAVIPSIARRVRVNLTTAPTTGTASAYIVGN